MPVVPIATLPIVADREHFSNRLNIKNLELNKEDRFPRWDFSISSGSQLNNQLVIEEPLKVSNMDVAQVVLPAPKAPIPRPSNVFLTHWVDVSNPNAARVGPSDEVLNAIWATIKMEARVTVTANGKRWADYFFSPKNLGGSLVFGQKGPLFFMSRGLIVVVVDIFNPLPLMIDGKVVKDPRQAQLAQKLPPNGALFSAKTTVRMLSYRAIGTEGQFIPFAVPRDIVAISNINVVIQKPFIVAGLDPEQERITAPPRQPIPMFNPVA